MQKVKRGFMIISSLLLAGFNILLTSPERVNADTLGQVTQYSVPTSNSGSREIVQGPDGNLWFTEEKTDKIGKITPSGTVTEYTLPFNTYISPLGITSGPDGAIWFTVSSSSSSVNPYVGKITTSGVITSYPLPANSVPIDIVTGPDGNLWVTGFGTTDVFRMQPDGDYTTFQVTGVPVSITSDPVNNAVWFTERPTVGNNGFMGRITMDGTLSEYAFPSGTTNANDVAKGPDGNIWFLTSVGSSHKVGYINSSFSFTTYTISNPGQSITSGLDGNLWITEFTAHKIAKVTTTGSITEHTLNIAFNPYGITMGSDGNLWFTKYAQSSNKIAKFGIGTFTDPDVDGDGLTGTQEISQGSSDHHEDSDYDGLDDLTESQWFSTRDDVFCNSSTSYCEYPDPLQRDLYIEVDWMVKPAPDGYSMQPTSTHLADIEIALSEQGIQPHFDAGQLGGGNEVPYYSNVYFEPDTGQVDFYDFKNGNSGLSINAQFDSVNRYGIWRYMLIGQQIEGSIAYGGMAFLGDDDSLLAYEGILNRGSNFDDRFPRTMLHELGHNLCLSDPAPGSSTWYTEQSTACVFEGIDNDPTPNPDYPDYPSAMNYEQQFLIDFSHGLNGVYDDHNDWQAVLYGFDDFSKQEYGDNIAHSYFNGKKIKKDPGRILKNPKAKSGKNIYRAPVVN